MGSFFRGLARSAGSLKPKPCRMLLSFISLKPSTPHGRAAEAESRPVQEGAEEAGGHVPEAALVLGPSR